MTEPFELYQLYDLLFEKYGKNALLFKNHINCFDKKIHLENGFVVMCYTNKQTFTFSTKEEVLDYFDSINEKNIFVRT